MMKEFNLIAVFDASYEHVLMCKRSVNPYKDLCNFVGGKIEPGENGLEAAYRELQEETSITKSDIKLTYFMDLVYYLYDIKIEVYVGRINKPVAVHGDEHELIWLDKDQDFFDKTRFAGEGNIGHIMEHIVLSEDKLFR